MFYDSLFRMDFLCLSAIFIAGIVYYFKWTFNFWERKNVPCLPPNIPFGNYGNPLAPKESLYQLLAKIYNFAKSKHEIHAGFYLFTKPIYIPIDLELTRNIFVGDFQHFMDRGINALEKVDPLSLNLFFITGQKWRNLRAKITPTFSSGKMKSMFFIMQNCAQNMIQYIDEQILPKEGIMNLQYITGCYTTDIIGSTAFGLECNSFVNPNSAFRFYGMQIFKLNLSDKLREMISFITPNLAKKFGVPLFGKEITKFYTDLVCSTIDYREKNRIVRNDFLQILIDMKNSDESILGIKEVVAQSFLFLIAGFETSSTTMSFALYEIALNPRIQETLRNEILTVLKKYNGELTYEGIAEMKYLQQVVDETLRKYPPIPFVVRRVTETYKVPGTDTVLEQGISVFIPVYAIHHDPEYYPDPDVFDPERFTEENKRTRKNYTYLPFGEGPRNCIGMRFALFQTKIGLAMLLKNYSVTINDKTKVPQEFDPFSFALVSKYDMLLNLNKLNY